MPLAVIAAKRTAVDPQVGKVQAKLYADCLERQYGVRPLIYFTNGFTSWFWDDAHAGERLVFGFFTQRELAWHAYQQHRKPLGGVRSLDEIADRVYQKKAVQSVCDNLEKGQRKALLVMAIGSGKTRTAISLVEVLQRYGWVKNILFLADRRELDRNTYAVFDIEDDVPTFAYELGEAIEEKHLVVKHVVANGYIEKALLNEHPFTRQGSLVALFDGKIDVAQKIVHRIDQLNERVAL